MREHNLNLDDFILDEIESIELVGEEDTIDITVADTHMFFANDIYTHNSSIGAEVVGADQMAGSIKKGMIGHFIVSIAKTLPQKESGKATMAILKSRFGKDGIIFSDIKFDNSTIQIDITNKSSGQSFLEKNVEKAVDTQDKIKSIMRIAAQQREEREAREAQEAIRRGTVPENNMIKTE
jgi:hypothetical protein